MSINTSFIIRRLLLCQLVLMSAVSPVLADNIRIVIDTGNETLKVMKGKRVLKSYNDIAIGRYGATYYKSQGDNKTPLGKFRIGWIKKSNLYHRFIGLNYPDLPTADRALVDGRIEESQWQAIRRASEAGKTPSQNTPLGGYIGIHGLGTGDAEVHGQYNWTNGCVALTNEQVDQLLKWVKIGTSVEIR